MAADTVTMPYKVAFKLEKYDNHRTPDDGAPDETVISETWFDGDGSEITDAERIAQLEAGHPGKE